MGAPLRFAKDIVDAVGHSHDDSGRFAAIVSDASEPDHRGFRSRDIRAASSGEKIGKVSHFEPPQRTVGTLVDHFLGFQTPKPPPPHQPPYEASSHGNISHHDTFEQAVGAIKSQHSDFSRHYMQTALPAIMDNVLKETVPGVDDSASAKVSDGSIRDLGSALFLDSYKHERPIAASGADWNMMTQKADEVGHVLAQKYLGTHNRYGSDFTADLNRGKLRNLVTEAWELGKREHASPIQVAANPNKHIGDIVFGKPQIPHVISASSLVKQPVAKNLAYCERIEGILAAEFEKAAQFEARFTK